MELCTIFGHKFKNPLLLKQALTHPSSLVKPNYQKLEFLGDRILGLVMAEYLFENFPDKKEGALAKRHVSLVCGASLTAVAKANNLGELIIMSKGEASSGGRENSSNLADVVEAIIAAIFLDVNDYHYVKNILVELWSDKLRLIEETPPDPKSQLQELLQAKKYPLPLYKLIEQSGPAHAPAFKMSLKLPKLGEEIITASSKKKAEVALAKKMLERLKNAT
ncbi:MAG: ribonuclease III [Rickettsiales bacterium]|jgi:ribonuclease-3